MPSPVATRSGLRRTSRRTTSLDTTDVKRDSTAITISDSADEVLSKPGEGKAPVTDQGVESDDEVEEYNFKNNIEQDREEDLEEDDDDIQSDENDHKIVEISSDDDAQSDSGLAERPWQYFETDRQRIEWEMMYATVTTFAINGNWETTEEYQHEKDKEMLRYMGDYPLPKWLIPADQAKQAYFRLLERSRWRSLGIQIYGRERNEWIASSTDASRLQQGLNVPRDRYPRQPSQQGHVPTALQEQKMQQQPVLQRPLSAPVPNQLPVPPAAALPQHHPVRLNGLPTHQHHAPQQLSQQMLQHQQQIQPHAQLSPHQQVPYQGQAPMPHQGPAGQPLPAPPNALPSQPHAQPIPVHPGHPGHPQYAHPGMGRPVGTPQQMAYNVPQGHSGPAMPQTNFPHTEQPKPPRSRIKKDSPTTTTPPPPPPTPPYELRQKPKERVGKNAPRKGARRQAEADEFPWTRPIDFKAEKAKADWDDSVYDQEVLREMEETRARNVAIINDLDAKVQEQQRAARANKKKRGADPSSDNEAPPPVVVAEKKKQQQHGQRKGESGGDPYHSGAFAFADKEDEERAKKMGFGDVDAAIKAGMAGKLAPDAQASLKICWNPGKRGATEALEQVRFTVKDTVMTRKQLDERPVLTKRAAECIVDFCPDLLWRGMLLRIASEAGYGNKDVRDRFCYNGCYCDKATITKRISAALGQKQVQPKSKGYAPGEWDWYDENIKDFSKYIDFFGKRHSHRNMLKIQMQGEKRKMAQRQSANDDSVKKIGSSSASADEDAGPSKKHKPDHVDEAGEESEEEDNADEGERADGHGDDRESTSSKDSDAVSMQDSDILDEIDDD